MTELLTLTAAAALKGWSIQRLAYNVKHGKIPIAKGKDGRKLYDADLIMAIDPIDRRFGKSPPKKKKPKRKAATLTKEQIAVVRQRIMAGEKQKYIAKDCKMNPDRLSLILSADAKGLYF